MLQKSHNFTRIAIWLGLALIASIVLAGCGSGKGTPASKKGRAVISLRWPDPASSERLVPIAAKSVRIQLKEGTTLVAERLLVRPDTFPWVTKVTITNVPITALAASATAYPNTDGTGVAQATITTPVTIQETGDTNLRLTMASTIDRIEMTPSGPLTLGIQESLIIQGVPKNAAGEIVIAGFLQYLIRPGTGVITMETGGKVTGLGVGAAEVTVSDPESGKIGRVEVNVVRSAFYRLIWIGGLPNAVHSEATGLNDNGEVVGFSDFPRPSAPNEMIRRGWIWRPIRNFTFGTLMDIGNVMQVTPTMVSIALQVRPSSINNAGQITGIFFNEDTSNAATYSFLWNGTFNPKASNFIVSFGQAINNAGKIAGGSNSSGLLWGEGMFPEGSYFEQSTPELETFGTGFSSINDAGLIVGDVTYRNNALVSRAFTFQNNTRTFLPFNTPFRGSHALDVNNKSNITGWLVEDRTDPVQDPFGSGMPCLWKDGALYELGIPDGFQSARGYALNDSDTVVLSAYKKQGDGSYNSTAFRWRYGNLEDLNTLIPPLFLTPQSGGRVLYTAVDINKNEQICGTGEQGAYLLIPQTGTGDLNAGIR